MDDGRVTFSEMGDMTDVYFQDGDDVTCPRCSLMTMLEDDGHWWDVRYGTERCIPVPNGAVMRHAPHAPRSCCNGRGPGVFGNRIETAEAAAARLGLERQDRRAQQQAERVRAAGEIDRAESSSVEPRTSQPRRAPWGRATSSSGPPSLRAGTAPPGRKTCCGRHAPSTLTPWRRRTSQASSQPAAMSAGSSP